MLLLDDLLQCQLLQWLIFNRIKLRHNDFIPAGSVASGELRFSYNNWTHLFLCSLRVYVLFWWHTQSHCSFFGILTLYLVIVVKITSLILFSCLEVEALSNWYDLVYFLLIHYLRLLISPSILFHLKIFIIMRCNSRVVNLLHLLLTYILYI